MDIRNPRSLKDLAGHRLANASQAGAIVLIFCLISIGSGALVTIINFCLSEAISCSGGGLSTMGLRSMLSTIQSVLPMLQSVLVLCLELGYTAAMLRISRGQYTSPQTLRAGIPRFWAMLRCYLIQSMMFFGVCTACIYIGTLIFSFTPMFRQAAELVAPLMTQASLDNPGALLDPAAMDQLMLAMIPLMALIGLLTALVCIPISYSFRQATYVLLDNPRFGAMTALRESVKMMKGHRLALFRLDLSFWWYYGLSLLATAVGYLDMILPAVGISLPFSEEVSYFLSYGLFLAVQFILYYCFRNRVETVYALAYQSVRPPEPEQSDGVVLGNIFQM